MKTTNYLDKSFGPVGSSAGIFLFAAGIFTTYISFYGLLLILIGGFLGFTSSCCTIDFERKRIKFSDNLFGFIKTGKWIVIDPGMKLGINESNIQWRAYSRGNRSIEIDDNDFRLILFDAEGYAIMPVQKADTLESARAKLEILIAKLQIKAIG